MGDEEYCFDCRKGIMHFDKGFPLLKYNDIKIKMSLNQLKYNNKREYSKAYAALILNRLGAQLKKEKFDGVIPVPIHKNKLRKRGYNQAELLAKEIAIGLEVPCYNNYLLRVIDTEPQKKLDDKERLKNLKKAFKCSQNIVELNKVLLVDDIYTTGATINGCALALKKGGVKYVAYTSVCIGTGI